MTVHRHYLVIAILIVTSSLHGVSAKGIDVLDVKDARDAYRAWKMEFDDKAADDVDLDDSQRFQIFENNYHRLSKEALDHGTDLDIKSELNQFATLSDDELDTYLGLNMTDLMESAEEEVIADKRSGTIPLSADYRRTLGASFPSADVSRSYSCRYGSWAVAAMYAMESQYKKLTDEIVLLSLHQLYQCSLVQSYCGNGYMDKAFFYAFYGQGLAERREYNDGDCQMAFTRNAVGRATIDKYKRLPVGDSYLMEAVSSIGPITAGVYAARDLFFYKFGIYGTDYSTCDSSKNINHAVTVVGYQPQKWMIKNSWGVGWGQNGHFYLSRFQDNNCQISSRAISITMTPTDKYDECYHVPIPHRQPCWHHSYHETSQNTCESQGCCWDSRTQECFVKAKITLYSARDFRDVSVTFYGSVADLTPYGMWKSTFSIKVHYGYFIAYNQKDYAPEGIFWRDMSLGILGPGEYSNLDDYSFAHDISSIRALPASPEIISLFHHTHGRGTMQSYYGSYPWIGHDNNDRFSSSYTRGGAWELCADVYSWDCKKTQGYYGNLDNLQLNDMVSGVRYS